MANDNDIWDLAEVIVEEYFDREIEFSDVFEHEDAEDLNEDELVVAHSRALELLDTIRFPLRGDV